MATVQVTFTGTWLFCGNGVEGIVVELSTYPYGNWSNLIRWNNGAGNSIDCVHYENGDWGYWGGGIMGHDLFGTWDLTGDTSDSGGNWECLAEFTIDPPVPSYPYATADLKRPLEAVWIRFDGGSWGAASSGTDQWGHNFDLSGEHGGKAQGTITDCATGSPIEGASVELQNASHVVVGTYVTNASGQWGPSVCIDSGTYHIHVSAEGYTTGISSGVAVLWDGSADIINLCLNATPSARKSDMKRHPITGALAHAYNTSGTIRLQWFEPGSTSPDYTIDVLTGQGSLSPSIEWEDDGRLRLCLSDGTTRKESATPWLLASWGNWT